MKKKRSLSNLQKNDLSKDRFASTLAIIIVTFLLAVFLLSILLYHVFKKSEMDRSEEAAISSFNQISIVMDSMRGNAKAIGLQTMQDEICSELLMATNYDYVNRILIGKTQRQLSVYTYIYPYIDSIYIYNRPAGMIATDSYFYKLSDETFQDVEVINWMDSFNKYRENMPFSRMLPHENQFDREGTPVYSYVFPWFSQTDTIDCAVIVNMSQKALLGTMKSLPSMENSWVQVVKENGEVLVDYSMASDFDGTDENLKKEITFSDSPALTKYEQNGKQYLIISCRINQWTYLKAIGWDTVFPGVLAIRKASFAIVSLVLLFALAIWSVNATKAYRIHRKTSLRYRELVDSARVHLGNARDSFLLDLITASNTINLEKIDEKMIEYSLPYGGHQPVTLVALKIIDYKKLVEILGPKSAYIYKYGIGNIFEEITTTYFDCTCVQTGDQQMYFLIGKRKNDSYQLALLDDILAEFQKKIRQFVDWEFFFVSDTDWLTLPELGILKQELDRYLSDSLFYHPQYHYTTEQGKERQNTSFEYPSTLEKRLLDALRARNLESVETLFQQFQLNFIDCKYSDNITVYSILALKIYNLVLEYGEEAEEESHYNSFLVELRQANSLERIAQIFKILFEAVSEMSERAHQKESNYERLQGIEQYIAENFQDPILTPQSVGEQFGLSSAYINRLFKKSKQTSLSEHINVVRLQNSARLLYETDLPAREIAVQCGFPNTNYFYTLFKKNYGLTPQTYRTHCSKDNM